MDFIIEQVFFFHFFAIHLPPVEEGEFLLYIMLKYNKVQKIGIAPVCQSPYHFFLLYSYFSSKLHSAFTCAP